jgi:hypothetical protein
LEFIDQLRAGQRLPLTANRDVSEAQRLFNVEIGIVRDWQRAYRIGNRRELCRELRLWSPEVRRRLQVEGDYQQAMTGVRRWAQS